MVYLSSFIINNTKHEAVNLEPADTHEILGKNKTDAQKFTLNVWSKLLHNQICEKVLNMDMVFTILCDHYSGIKNRVYIFHYFSDVWTSITPMGNVF